MSRKGKDVVVHLPAKKLILLYVGMFFVFEAIFFLSFTISDLVDYGDLGVIFYIYTPILLGLAVFLCVLSIKKTYYVLNNVRVIHFKMGKETSYEWSHIVYIDREWSEKHKTLLFYLENGKECFLSFDKEHLIYDYALQHCPLISDEEFVLRYTKKNL